MSQHHHDHSHHHHHHHHPAPGDYSRVFASATALNVVYVVVEATYGWLGNSLALLADAGHNASDVLGLLLAWAAHYAVRLPASERRTYGWRSSSILAALFNALLLLVAVGGIVGEALRRFFVPQQPAGMEMMCVAGVGVVVNTLTALLFFRGRRGDLNVRGAYLHMAADAGVSAGVVVAGAVVYATGNLWVDPATSLVIALVILLGTWELMLESVHLALHGVPKQIDMGRVRAYLSQLPGVVCVHDLHVWAMSTTETALTAHLVKPPIENDDRMLAAASRELRDRFGIEHITLQIERDAEDACCRTLCNEANEMGPNEMGPNEMGAE